MSLGLNARWLWRSSALRLTLLLSVIFALGMSAAMVAALNMGRDAVVQRVDDTLAGLARSVEVEDDTPPAPGVILRALDDLDGLPPGFVRIARVGGGTLRLEDDFRGSDEWRVRITEDADEEPILIALSLEESAEALDLLEGILWTTALLVIGLTLIIGLGLGLLAQRRIRRIRDTLEQLAAGNLKARTGLRRARDDLDDIARQLDFTAVELERLVAQTRHLSASLAHDLRTPLARLLARLERLPEGASREAALDEATRLSGIFDTIMRVAKIEASQGRDNLQLVDLGAFIREVAEIFGPVVEDAGKTLLVRETAPVQIQADRDMLMQAVANLIQNALVHGGDQITLVAEKRNLVVEDNGPGVDPKHFDDIVKPMVRLDTARHSDGTGLGLALVRAVADRHGGRLVLSPNTPSGLRVSLNFAHL